MSDANYTRTCEVCQTKFIVSTNKDGSPRKRKHIICSARCRKRKVYGFSHKKEWPDICRHEACTAKSKTRGYCKRHYNQILKHGEILWGEPGKSNVKVMLTCGFCRCKFGPLLRGQANRRLYCSKGCSAKAKTHTLGDDGVWCKPTQPCGYCGAPFIVNKDRKKFCSMSCSNTHASCGGLSEAARREVEAIRLMGQAIRDRIDLARAALVGPEIGALRRICARAKRKSATCCHCGASHMRRYRGSRYCSELCRATSAKEARERYKSSESYSVMRRSAKARRRAKTRGAIGIENIDPIKVFERDNWRCYLCGHPTPKSRRGTYRDNAPELEHIIPLSKGGTHTWDNVACACRKCNIEKSDQIYDNLGMMRGTGTRAG